MVPTDRTQTDTLSGGPVAPPSPLLPPINTKYARYIGRVGALAVALGVAGAFGAQPGMAWADGTSTTSSSTSSTTGGDSGSTPDPSAKAPTKPKPPRRQPKKPAPVIVDDSTGSATDDSSPSGDSSTSGESSSSDESSPKPAAAAAKPPRAPKRPNKTPKSATATTPKPAAPDTNDDDPGQPSPVGTQNITTPMNFAGTTATATSGPAATSAVPPALAGPTALAATQSNPVAAVTPKAPALPTPNQVVKTIKAFVTQCACTVITGTLKAMKALGDMFTSAPSAPNNGGGQAVGMWAVLGWVRKQTEFVATAFNRSPIGHAINGVTTQITKYITDIGLSPLGYQFSSRVGQFLAQCESSAKLPADLDRTTVVSGLSEPTDFAILADKNDPTKPYRILITEKAGSIKVYNPDTETTTTLITLGTVSADGERGLVGIEVDPNFWSSDKVGYHTIYASYTNADNYDQLSSFVVDETVENVASETMLLKSDQLGNNFHHGGDLAFDPTGTHLYWAVGDNANSANAQSLSTIHGKVLRLNRDGSAPADNPFVDVPGAVPQVYAYGFRNPFRFNFTADGKLLVGDVGEAAWEELDVVTPGGNYGWPGEEGACTDCTTINPIYQYAHQTQFHTGSITAVLPYSGTALPAKYQGKVFIADYSLGWIKELTFDSQYTSLISERMLDSTAGAVVKLSQGPDGNIYQLNIFPGTLSVIAPSAGNRAPTAVIHASSTSGPGNSLTVNFTGSQSTDPDGDPLTYHWDFGNGQTSNIANPTATFTNSGAYTAYTVTLTTSDGEKSNKATQRIVVGSTPPSAVITVSNNKYNAGDTITYSAVGTDAEDGTLPTTAYSWKVEFHHGEHLHPFLDNGTGTGGAITIPRTPDQLSNTWYRIIVTVTDSSGLSTDEYVDVHPNLVTMTYQSNHPNGTFTIDGVPHKGTFTEQGVVGVQHVLNVASPQYSGTDQLVFDGWSDGGAQSHMIVTPNADGTYTVTFDVVPLSAVV
ncbi:PQQ-dependent sugar dehydrogenase [Mycobacterium sp. ST-F2]|uniref:PQQ-dependent sugar dehydrogenase n=1 Tax=Mycobacterium sp. ST-F2 TaxID=1490484 RepID=UPI0009F9C681|nr:PQQ-dependent sugar dehydrogenase [Mycobacterium sp. ST-F2]